VEVEARQTMRFETQEGPQLSISAKLRIMGSTLKDGDSLELTGRLSKLVYSTTESYVLRRDLTVPLAQRPRAKFSITVRPLEPDDMSQMLAERPEGMRLGVLRAGLPQCYVALTDNSELCYMQWLVPPSQKERLRDLRFRDLPCFDDDSVLLEFAYTFKRFRGLGIMAPAMAYIAEQNKQAHWAVTYVDRTNIPSLRGCHNAGFSPHRLCRRRWRLFHLKQTVMEPASLESFWNKGTA
jgi:hypothetical protein